MQLKKKEANGLTRQLVVVIAIDRHACVDDDGIRIPCECAFPKSRVYGQPLGSLEK
jgi:hypothetical protein